MTKDKEPTQRSQPQRWDSKRERWTTDREVESIDIPVPKRSAWDRLLGKAAKPRDSDQLDE